MKKIFLLVVSLFILTPAFATQYYCTYFENGKPGLLGFDDANCTTGSSLCTKGKMLLSQGKCKPAEQKTTIENTPMEQKEVTVDGCSCIVYTQNGKYSGYSCGKFNGNFNGHHYSSNSNCNVKEAGEKIKSMYGKK